MTDIPWPLCYFSAHFKIPLTFPNLVRKQLGAYLLSLSVFKVTLKILVVAIVASLLSGCAIYYRDADSGAEHIWGFGHLAIKGHPPLDGKQALVRRTTLTGVALGVYDGSFGISIGWDQRERIIIYDENAAFTIKRPASNDYFDFKIGTYPFELDSLDNTSQQSFETKEDQP